MHLTLAQIRMAKNSDTPKLEKMISDMAFEMSGRRFRRNRKQEILRAIKKREIFVSTADNKMITGFIHGIIHNDIMDGAPNLFISLFYVEPRYRNKKVGSELLDSIIKFGMQEKIFEYETSTYDSNVRRLYERFGFQQDRGEIFLQLDSSVYERDFEAGIDKAQGVK